MRNTILYLQVPAKPYLIVNIIKFVIYLIVIYYYYHGRFSRDQPWVKISFKVPNNKNRINK